MIYMISRRTVFYKQLIVEIGKDLEEDIMYAKMLDSPEFLKNLAENMKNM